MSLSSNQRRDQRRRLVVSWKRSAGQADAPASDSPRASAAYDPDALPEKQRGPAVLLPTGLGGLSLTIAAVLVPLGGIVAAACSGPFFGRDLFVGGGRFARTVAAAGAVFDPLGIASLQIWLAQTLLVAAAGVALIVRLMRRHRRDDFNGRFRAWGWMAFVLVATACDGVVPVGRLVAAVFSDATGIVLGPNGIGWWVAISSLVVVAVSLWAVLPLHERLATSIWLSLAVAAWGASAAATCLADGRDRIVAVGIAAWSFGAAFAFAAMLAAARSVIREVRGQCGVAKPKAAKPAKADAAKPAAPTMEDDDVDSSAFDREAATGDDSETEYTDGSEQEEQRHLSKAERKRLRKLARMNGAAA
jgi:hypothetical protein